MGRSIFQLRQQLIAAMVLLVALAVRSEAEVRLTMSQPTYSVGEHVRFILRNDTKAMIHVMSWPGWNMWDSVGTRVAPCLFSQIVLDIHPGGAVSGGWDQLNCWDESQLQVPPGRYRVRYGYISECCPGESYSVETWFTIGVAPVEPASWGRIKSLFR